MAVFNNILAGASGATGAAGSQIDRSLRFDSASTSYLSRTPSSAGNSKTFTWSGWVKQVVVDGTSQTHILAAGSSPYFQFYFVGPTLYVQTNLGYIEATQKFRDPSAWYHFVVAVDTTQATATNRIRFYVNGEEVTDFATDQRSSITQNADLAINSTVEHRIGAQTAATAYSNMYLAGVHFVDGTQLAPTDFGEYDDNNNWNPKAFSGSYGTNGYRLDFSDNSSASALGTDAAGSNDWTVNNISVASGSGNDSLIDTPTNYTAGSGNNGGNYCTLNPLTLSYGTLSNGNLNYVGDNSNHDMIVGTAAASSGKWYFETTLSNNVSMAGVVNLDSYTPRSNPTYPGGNAASWGYYPDSGGSPGLYNNNARTDTLTSSGSGDVIGVALDVNAGTCSWYKNNSLLITKTIGSGTWSFVVGHLGADCSVNFGQRPFTYTPPTGYLSLCTENLPDPTIADGSTAFDTSLYTGTGSTQSITGLGFSPDLVWAKSRSYAYQHGLVDSVRGVSRWLGSNSTSAEDYTSGSYLTAFNSDGFDVGTGGVFNASGETYVGWAWDAGSSTSSNSDGSITANVRVSQTNGFSIISYTGNSTVGATVGHGLNDVPGLVIIKNRTTGSLPWVIKMTGMTGGQRLQFDTGGVYTEAAGAGSVWNATNPSSSVITLGDINYSNASSNNYIGYCWAPVSGYSSFGSYLGNGSTSGPFVFLGFRPKVIIIKDITGTNHWGIIDTERDPYNSAGRWLLPNDASAEIDFTSSYPNDILSNGFKIRNTGGLTNTSGSTYVYAAFAEHPFKTARAF